MVTLGTRAGWKVPKVIVQNFDVLNFSLFIPAHFESWSKANWAVPPTDRHVSPQTTRRRSSAYAMISQFGTVQDSRIVSGTKFQISGPRTDPCAVPLVSVFSTVVPLSVMVTTRSRR